MQRILLFIGIAWLFSCSPVRMVKPLEKGEQALGGNIGGPLIEFAGAPITIPYTSAFYAKGLSEKTTVFGSLHLTALSFGVFQTDIGLCQQLWANHSKTLGLTANPAFHFAIDRWERNARFWPQLDIQLYKEFKNKQLIYAGVGNWIELKNTRPHNELQPQFWFVSPQAGFKWGKNKWVYGFESKWLAPGVANTPNVVDYIGINDKGALSLYFNLIKKF